ncbi:MAG: hypothetical protein ACKVXR_13665 [Planctomycetota bacterium]
MRTSAVLLLAIGTYGAGLISARLLFHSDHDGVVASRLVDDALRIQTFDAPVRSTASEPPALEMPDSRVPALTERPPDPPPPVLPAEAPKQVSTIDPSDPRTLPEGTLADMKMKKDAVEEFLLERTLPILMQRFDDGLSEAVAYGDTYSPTDYEPMRTTIYAVQQRPGEPWYRAVLPREQYPDLYVYKDEVYRLENAVLERERAEARERAKARK